MKEKATHITQLIVLLLILAVAHFWFSEDPETQTYLYKVSFGVSITLAISIAVWVIVNFKFVWHTVRTHLPWAFYKPIRLTIAYLFRIEIDGKYLLIRNKRNINGFQPVGGVYKYLNRENAQFFDQIGLITDTKIERDQISEHDLRMRLKKRHKLLAFIQWFNKKENREIDPWREFQEELIATGLLSQSTFPHIQYRFVRQHKELKYSDHHKITEYKVADIYELQPANEAQKNELRQLMASGDERILVATSDQISEGKKDEKIILEHTYKVV